MKHARLLIITLLIAVTSTALALSMKLSAPAINFPKDYDVAKAERIHAVLRQEKFKFVDGLHSYWEPNWGTTIVYGGQMDSLNEFLQELQQLKDVSLEVEFLKTRSVGLWELHYGHTKRDTLRVVVNLEADTLNLAKLKLPAWNKP